MPTPLPVSTSPAHDPASSLQDDMVDHTDPRAPIWQTLSAVWQFHALYAMADLGIADHLDNGPLTAPELAHRCGAQPDLLTRLLRALIAMGYLHLTAASDHTDREAGAESDKYGLTEQGLTLRLASPGSMRWAILSTGEPGTRAAMADLPNTIRTGESGFVAAHGTLYAYLETQPDAARVFNRFMTSRSQDAAESLARNYDLSGVGHIADIGSGIGTITAALLRHAADPTCTAVLLDRPQVIEAAQTFMTEQGLQGRCGYMAGDFTLNVPEDADLYLLGSIIHNLSDQHAVRLLRTIRSAMASDSRLLCLDMLVPATPSAHISTYLDLRMMTLFPGGQERTQTQYASLLDQAGLHLTRVVDLPPTPMNALEAVPRS